MNGRAYGGGWVLPFCRILMYDERKDGGGLYMGLIHSYALWNNKGGVGKSTITFHLSMRYAELHPEHNVLVIDMCPQANSSMMLLGGGSKGEENVVKFCEEITPRSVVGYLSTVITNGRGAKLPDPYDFLVKINNLNENAPKNLYLLCGDGNLEPLAPAINEAASAKPLTVSTRPWKWVQEIIKTFIYNLADSSNKDWMVFVDTNPSFSIYTQMAVSSVERLITPINADDSSRTAANAMVALLHGTDTPHPIYGSWTYAKMAKDEGVSVPQIHMLIGNRLTQFEGPAAAFRALSEATSTSLYEIYQKHPDYFVTAKTSISNRTEFSAYYSLPLRDFNTAGVVCAHQGKLLSAMKQGHYQVYASEVKVNIERLRECKKAIDLVVAKL